MSNGAKSMPEHDSRQYHSKNEMRNALSLQIASLEMNRQRLCSQFNSLSSFNSLLPAEIKAAIFYKSLQLPCPLYDGDGKVECSEVITPFFLGKICRDWRDLVWSSPLLWTNIHICVTRRRCKAQANLLREWLSRTANCPLSFCLTSGELEPEAWDYNPPEEILTILVSTSERWKQAEFHIPDVQFWFDAITDAQNSLPLLTTAAVEFESSSDEQEPFNLFSAAPQLSALHLYQPCLADVLAPWHQLQEFTSTNSSVDEIREFLHKASNIIRCSFRDIDSSTSYSSHLFSRPLALDRLEYIELRFESLVNTASTLILGSIKLPSLREVFLHGSFIFTDAAILPRITESFSASSLLEKFTLGGQLRPDRILIQALENIPSIKELHLNLDNQLVTDDQFLTRELLQRLCPPHTSIMILLPNLRNFTFQGPTSLNDHMPLFRDMLLYRFRQCTSQPTGLCAEEEAISQLQSVSIRSLRKLVISQDIQDELDILVQEGLVLSISTL